MAGITKTVLIVFTICLVAFLSGAEGGRDFSTKGREVYNHQAFWFPHFPWWWASINKAESGPKDIAKGGEVYNPQAFWFPHFPWWWASINKAESGPKDIAKGGEVYNPQAFWFPHFPWWWASNDKAESGPKDIAKGGEVYNPQAFWFPHFPWWWASINKAESGPNDIAKGDPRNMEVPQVDGTAGNGYLPEVDSVVSTKGEEVYNPQAFWFPHFHWWWPGSRRTEIRPEDKGKEDTTNMEVPKIGGMAGYGYP